MNNENNVLSPEIKKILKDIEKVQKLNDDLKDSTSASIEKSMLNLVSNIFEKVFNDNMSNNINNKKCHGCCGDGWIENSFGDIKICPICKGEGELKKEKEDNNDNINNKKCHGCCGDGWIENSFGELKIKKENIEYDIQLFPSISISLV